MSKISPLLIFGMSARAFSGTSAVCPGAGVVPGPVGGVTVPGLTTTEKRWVPPAAALVLATRAAAVPVATGPLESASSELTLPLPVAAGVARVVALVGLGPGLGRRGLLAPGVDQPGAGLRDGHGR